MDDLAANEYRVLVVDDDPLIRDLFMTTLELDGFTVRAVVDGAVALDLLENESFDVVVLDMMMPAVSGLEVLERIHANPLLHGLRTVVCSAHDNDIQRDVAKQFGAPTWLVKPVTPDDLLAAVASVLALDR